MLPRSYALTLSRFSSPLGTPHSALRAGFTLVEILIAIGILGLVLVSIFSTWTAILRATRVGLDAAATVQRARMVAHVLEDSLSSAQLFSANLQYYTLQADNGDEPSLSFVARLSPQFPRSGKFGDLDMRRLTFSVERGSEGRELVLRQAPVLFMGPDGVLQLDTDEKEHPLVLAKNVKEFNAQFWDPKEGWIDEWTATNQLPPLVKVTLQLLDKADSTAPPEEITRIVSIPTLAVPPVWQVPRGFQGGPGGQPNLTPPGAAPPGANPNAQMPGFQMPGGAGRTQ
jgi:prepilin-type N-terminal cleavage/methylation domain-containing protein